MMVELTLEQAEALLAYLGTRPINEAVRGFSWLTEAIEKAKADSNG